MSEILPKKEKAPGRTRSLWVADALWAEVEELGRQSGNSTSKTVVYLLEAAVKALRLEQAKAHGEPPTES